MSNETPKKELKKRNFWSKIRKIRKKKEIIIGFSIIGVFFLSSMGLYYYMSGFSNWTIISLPQTGYYYGGMKIAHVGISTPLSDPSVLIASNYSTALYYGELLESNNPWYNDKQYFTFNFTDFKFFAPIDTELYIHTAQRDRYSMPFEIYFNPYNDTGLTTLLNFLNVQKCGVAVPGYHDACHLTDGEDIGENLTGGWHDAGDYNKYSYNTAYTIYNLLSAYNLSKNDFDANRNGIPDILDEALWGLNWLVRMQSSDGGVYDKISSGFSYWGTPSKEEGVRTTYTEEYTGTAAAFAACTAFASQILNSTNSTFSQNLLQKSEKAFSWVEKNSTSFQTDELGEYPGNSYTIGWAAAELYRATDNPVYLNYSLTYLNYTHANLGYISGWGDDNLLGLYALMSCVNNQLKTTITNYLISNSLNIQNGTANNAYNLPNRVSRSWGINSNILNYFRDSYYLYLYTNNTGYLQKCVRAFNWVVGDNPWRISFITGMGSVNVQHPYTRLDEPIDGGIVPGPIAFSSNHTQYIDTNSNSANGWMYNEYTINLNSEGILCYSLLMLPLFESV